MILWGGEYGAAFDDATVSAVSGRQVRAHLWSGRWHGFWSGKRDGSENRKFCRHKLLAAGEVKVLITDSGLPGL